ncbi:sugar phosphate isomerase/epimerase family protein [Flavobacterium johnsoniae]|uniref:Xylose isomerase domain protein TIM barrel n=1 Tax=Flavobacterium johnsoniae (strain ATCC 17061 / DSM 2064 / JCM 8514 / BCRC 14874 / CCUG 350202 / NBRC 14942 / NCIMB 11054 / UW101) TaxID=376686 RepID=A5FHW1_FLAJ1|nr:sugar phosphate isomerase/epimerase [Flavobacterium johnsoniae]ABQ05216.1 Xylose isomerase domain protein TIM barrel [Flavobacterium johnsoniae UW101]OXE96930.1 xylose isomerase [Flavobacterium johnsoniae UW101]WQG82980.1 sugar phosphate isomerase/epimerase [Flavobacterium johnsoniae UW101]SHL63475.1 Sugar phosphate isomerase/epimerase [Flavobacterium johnsoniae]
MITRRTFIINTSLTAATVLALPSLAFSMYKKEIGLQLYTLREELPKNVKAVLEKVAASGYTNVETYGFSIKDQFWGLSPVELKKILDENNLKAVSGHYNLGSFLYDGNTAELIASIEAAKTLKSEFLTVPWVDESFRKSLEDYKKIASRLNQAAKMCADSGLKLAYHNHDFEFQKHDGVTGYEILLNGTDKSLVCFELDLYWVVRSGNDPLQLFKENPGRFKMWHVKDMDKQNQALNTEVGSGLIDFKPFFAAAKQAGMVHFFVEQENNFAVNSFQSIKTSCGFISQKLI